MSHPLVDQHFAMALFLALWCMFVGLDFSEFLHRFYWGSYGLSFAAIWSDPTKRFDTGE